jgi:hypothetical protein
MKRSLYSKPAQGISLKPMFQLAMRTVEDYCERNNLAIAGYYESPDIVKSASPSLFAEKVGEKLREHFKDAFLLHNIWQENSKFALRPFIKEVTKKRRVFSSRIVFFSLASGVTRRTRSTLRTKTSSKRLLSCRKRTFA